ncbi:MAG: hypothetical protein FJY86_03765 [Candidatus Diapherotrites archaeon]|uniref:Uncharacterized protein n=1 Tax=Candidatus Iainarchaeum sp. TaxID=3101447 RepID=A0A8T4C7Y4_9ARCH|nr:hypothetical protein [Candidatus Diapherotrites archaeon]
MKGILVIILAILLIPSVLALQGIDAENAVAIGNYLEQGERAVVYKSLPLMNGAVKYWLVSVLQNDAIRTIVPLADKDGVLVPKSVLRTNVISANYLVQRLAVIKTGVPWLVSLTTSNSLDELANAVDNEQFDVDIVAETVPSSSLKLSISSLKGKLATISTEIRSASKSIQDLSARETSLFNVSITVDDALSLPDEYADLFDRMSYLKDSAAEYDNMVSAVKNEIATLNTIDAQEKSQLLGLLSPLGSNQSLSSALSTYTSVSADNAQRVSTEYASLPTKASALEAELDLRVLRVAAYNVLYGEDKSFKTATNFFSLENAAITLLDSSNAELFVNQSALSNLRGAWESAENAFAKRQYSTAKDLGEKAKGFAKQVVNDGVRESSSSALEQNLVSGAALVLGGLAFILIVRFAWSQLKPKPIDES